MATSDTSSASRQFIGRYEVVNVLGAGTYGVVYLATYNGKQYAIKQIPIGADSNPLDALKELSFYTIMSHPRIMAPYEYIVSNNGKTLNIVMHRGGSTLFNTFLSGRRATEQEIRLIAQQLLSALDYLHANSIVHRDLKPTNIIMDEMNVNIIDFGLATMIYKERGALSLNVQTITHRSPEVIENKQYTVSSDIWSLGIILLELALGHIYFRRMTEPQILSFITDERNRLAQDVQATALSPQGKDLILAMLKYNPLERITAHAALHHPWLSQFPYMGPEKIPLPVIPIDDSLLAQWLSFPAVSQVLGNVHPALVRYTYRLANILIEHDPTFVVNTQVISILYRIAAGILVEAEAPKIQIRSDAGAQLIDSIFKRLNYNIFVE